MIGFSMFLFTSLLVSFWWQRHLLASISKALWSNSVDILSKCRKVETAILLERGVENQALEGLRVNLFCHFYMHVFMTRLFQDLCANCARSGAFVCPLLHHFGHHFVIISTNFFKHLFEVGIFLASGSR